MNKIKKLLFSNVLPIIGKCFLHKNKYVNVIYYHDVVLGTGYSFQKTNYEFFKKQMIYIANEGYETLRFDDLTDENIKYARKKVLIVFDDGWKSNYHQIYELMKNLGIKYNIYLTISKIGSDPNYLSWEQVVKMHDEGYVGFGIHTYSHPDMSDLSKVDIAKEVDLANSIFQERLGYKALDFCYPYGAWSEETNKYISSNRIYQRVYTSNLMYSYKQDETLIFGRNGISNDESWAVFKAKLRGEFNVFEFLKK